MTNTDFNSEQSLGHLAGKTTRALWSRLYNDFLKAGHDVTVDQWIVLINLWKQNGQFQQELADVSSKDKTSITRLIDGLEKRNLVVRVPDTADRRHKRIYLTSKGKALQKKLVPLAEKKLSQAQHNIKAEHMEICKNVLRQIYANLNGSGNEKV